MPTYAIPTFNYSTGTASGSPGLTALTDYINNLNRNAQTLALQARVPGGAGLEAQSSANIGSELRGEVAPDVMRLLQRQAAERGVRTGSPEAPATNAAYLQALGLTSMERQATGQRDLSAAYARNPAAPLFDPTTQLLTPYQSGTLSLEQQRLLQQREQEANRLQLEYDRLAQEAELRAQAAARTGTGTGAGVGTAVNPATRTATGPTGALLQQPYTQADWWASIGYGQPTTPGGGTQGSYTIGTDVLDPSWFDSLISDQPPAGMIDTGAPVGTIEGGGGSSAPGIDWASLFSPELGIDSSLYGGG